MSNHNSTNLVDAEARANAPASFTVHPAPQSENGMGKLGAFALGVVTGIVGLAVTAVIVDNLENGNGANDSADSDVFDPIDG